MKATWSGTQDGAVAGVAAVLFTADRRVFFQFDDDDRSIRVAHDWERTEALLQMLAWRDSPQPPVT